MQAKVKSTFHTIGLFVILGIPGYVLATNTHSELTDPFYEQELVITILEAKVAELEGELKVANKTCRSPILLDPVYAHQQNLP